MRIVPINNSQTSFKSYYPLLEEEIYQNFGRTWGTSIEKAMSDLAEIAYTDGAGLDVMIRTIENEDIFKRGINIAVADTKSNMLPDYLMHGNIEKFPHIKGSIYVENVPKLDMWSKIVCDTTKTLIDTFKICREKPCMFDYYKKIFK